MSITKLTESRYVGLSRDIKPIGARLGASFYEYDTELIYDKTLNVQTANGWKLRVAIIEGGGAISDTLKNQITVKSLLGINYLVIMAGTDLTVFELNDIVIGEKEVGKIAMMKVISVPVTTTAQFGSAVQGNVS